ncbi:hypothetical protein ACO0LC_27475 [Undibacterium sp. JH2W]|uniref:hypothetical protein n=1 Tax=Undibacterium sp. JH2W TaxID=3413037 RepID=UPI003BF24D13
MKTSLTDWLITALAYIVICAVLSIINHEEDNLPGADQPERQAAPASQAAATLHASVSAQLSQKMAPSTERAALNKLAQEAERMTGFAASEQ